MKIRRAVANNRRKTFEITAGRRRLCFPYAKAKPQPSAEDPVKNVEVDPELGREAFTYTLRSGREGTVHIDDVLEYNEDPTTLRDLLLYKLTIEAQDRLQKSPLSRREIIRRLGTSPTQFYRLLDQTNYRKSVDQMLALLHILDCRVDVVIKDRLARPA